jgi:orotate phosphoribosyltransferase-like protein
MKKCWILSRFTLISLLCISSLLFTSACSIPTQDETEMLEDLLNRLDAVEGEITFVTKDGETVNIQITKESSQEVNEETGIAINTDKKEVTTEKPGNILPGICSKEDVFRLLGILDQAMELRNKGLSWCSTAMELGYTSDSMYAQLEETGERELKDALEQGLINQEEVKKKLSEFTASARKWVDKIFADSSLDSPGSLNDYLPVLNSIEDIFKMLGVWDKAHSLSEQGLAWSHIADELGYTSDSMYTALVAKIEMMLKEAYSAGLLSQEKMEYKINYYSDTGLKWINKIFDDVISNTPVGISDILPTLESYEDVFRLLGTWEKASALQEQGLSWSSIAIELGYSEESMYKKIKEIAEQELHDAKISGLINYDQYKEMLDLYDTSVESWVKEIFSDLNDTSVSA